MKTITKSLPTPYYAVIFTSTRTSNDSVKLKSSDVVGSENDAAEEFTNYSDMADKMLQLAMKQDGFLGVDSAREDVGITVSYWRDLDAIANWKSDSEHLQAQMLGRATWYKDYNVRVAKVEKDYSF